MHKNNAALNKFAKSLVTFAILSVPLASMADYTDEAHIEIGPKTCTCKITGAEGNMWNYQVTATYTEKVVAKGNKDVYLVGKGYNGTTNSRVDDLTEISTAPTYATASNQCGIALAGLKATGSCSNASVVPPTMSDESIHEVGERTRYFNLSAAEVANLDYLNQSEQRNLDYALAMAEISSNQRELSDEIRLYRTIAEIYERHSEDDRDLLRSSLHKVKIVTGRRHRY